MGIAPSRFGIHARLHLPLSLSTSQAGDGLRTNCATTAPNVRSDISEMIPREMAQ